MAVHEKNISFAEEQRRKIAESVISTASSLESKKEQSDEAAAVSSGNPFIQTVTSLSETRKKRKDVLIGVHVTEEERNDLRNMFCSKGCSLAVAYRSAMSYLKEDLAQGKAKITNNGDIIRIS